MWLRVSALSLNGFCDLRSAGAHGLVMTTWEAWGHDRRQHGWRRRCMVLPEEGTGLEFTLCLDRQQPDRAFVLVFGGFKTGVF